MQCSGWRRKEWPEKCLADREQFLENECKYIEDINLLEYFSVTTVVKITEHSRSHENRHLIRSLDLAQRQRIAAVEVGHHE
jgi:hypothetical protein